MTPSEASLKIMGIKGVETNIIDNNLEISGKVKAVKRADKVMQDFIPNHCKPMLIVENYERDLAIYNYKFNS